jgi:hypothetical protein
LIVMRIQIFKKIWVWAAVLSGGLLLASPVLAQNITQGYGADSIIKNGMIVGLKTDDLHKVETINSDQYDRLHGVVVGLNESAVLIGNTNEEIYVATTGRYTVLVSDQNGGISSGDYVTVSAVSGIGMKAGESDPVILGRSIDSYDPSDSNQIVNTVTVKDSKGKEQQLRIGQVIVDISVGKNPLLRTDNSLPSYLRKAAETIAGKPVSATRVYMGLAVLGVASLIAGSLIYSGVRSGLIAIGRNPLSKKMIIRGLFQVVIIGMTVFLSGIFGVYLLLKL